MSPRSGNIQPTIDLDEHNETANAKRIAEVMLNAAASAYVNLTAFALTNSNAQAVALVDSTGAQITLKNPTTFKGATLTANEAQLYAVPAANKAWITSIRCRNTANTTEVINIGIRVTGVATTYTIFTATLTLNESVEFVGDEGPIGLEGTASIRGYSTNAGNVDFIISGELL